MLLLLQLPPLIGLLRPKVTKVAHRPSRTRGGEPVSGALRAGQTVSVSLTANIMIITGGGDATNVRRPTLRGPSPEGRHRDRSGGFDDFDASRVKVFDN